MKGFINKIRLMNKWFYQSRYRIFTLIFFIFLIFPTVAYPILKNILSSEKDGLNENRNMNEFEFSIQDFGTNFDNFYQDNFPFRNSLIPLYNKYYYKIYSQYFITNINGWKVIDEPEQNQSDIIELNIIDDRVKNKLNIAEEPVNIILKEEKIDEFKRIRNVLIDTDNYFNSLNKKLIIQICPRKDHIIKRMTDVTEMDLFYSYMIQNSNLSFLYPKNEFFDFPLNYMIYDEYTGHHNFIGAYVSWQEIQKKAGIATTDISSLDITESEIDVRKTAIIPYVTSGCYSYNQDLPDIRKTEYIKTILYNVAYKPEIEVEAIHNNDCYRIEFKSNNKNGQTVFVTGDSFLESQIQYAIKDFEFSYFSHLYNLSAAINNQTYRANTKRHIENADVIVVVIGENNLISTNLEHNPGLEIRLSFLLELAKEIYK